MWKIFWKFPFIAVVALPAFAMETGAGVNTSRVAQVAKVAIVVAQAPRRIDSNEIIRSLAPIDYLPEHSGKKRSIDLDIRFRVNSTKLSRSAVEQLDELAVAIKASSLKEARFQIAGHTDASGAAAYNQSLSARRAAAVKTYLVSRHGIRAARLETVGWGEEKLKNPISPEAAENRRVEVTVLSAFRKTDRPESRQESRPKKIEW